MLGIKVRRPDQKGSSQEACHCDRHPKCLHTQMFTIPEVGSRSAYGKDPQRRGRNYWATRNSMVQSKPEATWFRAAKLP